MRSKHCKHIVDILLGVGLLLLMSYQVTGEAGHEWTGIVMTVLMILHQILNRKWYTALFEEREEIPVDDRFVWIEGGSFLMGSPDRKRLPQQEISTAHIAIMEGV